MSQCECPSCQTNGTLAIEQRRNRAALRKAAALKAAEELDKGIWTMRTLFRNEEQLKRAAAIVERHMEQLESL